MQCSVGVTGVSLEHSCDAWRKRHFAEGGGKESRDGRSSLAPNLPPANRTTTTVPHTLSVDVYERDSFSHSFASVASR